MGIVRFLDNHQQQPEISSKKLQSELFIFWCCHMARSRLWQSMFLCFCSLCLLCQAESDDLTLLPVSDIFKSLNLRNVWAGSSTWCSHPHPTLHVLLSINDSANEQRTPYLFEGFNRSQYKSSLRTSDVDFKVLTGDTFLVTGRNRESCTSQLWNDTHYIPSKGYSSPWNGFFMPPEKEEISGSCLNFVSSDYPLLFFTNFFSTNFGHILHDSFPSLLILLKFAVDGLLGPLFGNARVLLPDTVLSRSIVEWAVGPSVFRNNFIIFKVGEKNCLRSPTIGVLQYNGNNFAASQNPVVMTMARTIFDEYIQHHSYPPCKSRRVVYYTRSGSTVQNGRKVADEDKVVQVISSALQDYDWDPESLFIFNGTRPIAEQYDIFRCADIVIGPHGSGLANLVWTRMSSGCSDPVNVIEFMCGPQSTNNMCEGYPLRQYFWHLHGLPWARYHVLVTSPSPTREFFNVPLNALDSLLRAVLKFKTTSLVDTILLDNSWTSSNNITIYSKFMAAFVWS